MRNVKSISGVLAGVLIAGVASVALMSGPHWASADEATVKVGIALPLTGADAADAKLIENGFLEAIDEANANGGVAGHKIEAVVKDSGTATAGQYDPAQAATNTKDLVGDPAVVAVLGPEMSGEGKAMAPILSEADMALITPSSTNPDLTDPAHAAQFMPKGKPIYFRTVTTDAFQGPNMANFYKETLKVSNVYVLDDAGAYGVGIADAFQKQAEKIGLKVLGRDQLDPKEADYTTVLTKIKALNPDSIYYGGVNQAGVKLAKQVADVLPKVIKGAGDGIYSQEFLTGVGFPAAEGWYATNAGPHLTDDPAAAKFVDTYKSKYSMSPNDYAITAYDGALVVLDAIKRVADAKQEINRSTVRAAMEKANLKTLQGVVSFDKMGDINDRTVSVFQFKKNDKFPLDDSGHQISYIGVAPQS
jgi:branched-chain amino acid transport system substrate-binding protein